VQLRFFVGVAGCYDQSSPLGHLEGLESTGLPAITDPCNVDFSGDEPLRSECYHKISAIRWYHNCYAGFPPQSQ